MSKATHFQTSFAGLFLDLIENYLQYALPGVGRYYSGVPNTRLQERPL